MINNLLDFEQNSCIERSADVCIVGAGTAGLFLARSLIKAKLKVILIELGGESTLSAEHSFDEPTYSKENYLGAKFGRVSGLGGTSAKWGGQMITLAESDFLYSDTESGEPLWPIDFNELESYYKKVARTLRIVDPSDDRILDSSVGSLVALSDLSEYFELRASSWIPFRRRNFAKGFKRTIHNSDLLEIWLNSRLRTFSDASWNGSALQCLSFEGDGQRSLVVSSKAYVLAMGALETTKTIMSLERFNQGLGPQGRPFCDHVSVCVGEMIIKRRSTFLSYFSPFFVKGVMRSLRFELNGKGQHDLKTGSAFVHFVTAHKPGSALDILRTLARRFQGESISLRFKGVNFGEILSDLFRIIWWRFAKGRLILNHGGAIRILVDIEQKPNLENFIFCDSNSRLELSWSVTPTDKRAVENVAKCFETAWNSSPELSDLAEVKIADPGELQLANYFDVYHPTGSLPMGRSPDTSVLDKNLRLWSSSNLYVSSTAVFPTGGSANPGYTHLALTERLSDHLQAQVNRFSSESIQD